MKTSHALILLGSFAAATPADAAFSLVDDMEGADQWTGAGALVADPADAGNTVYGVNHTGSGTPSAYRALPTISSGTATVFFRIRSTETNGLVDWVLGTSDSAAPNDWGNFEGYMRLAEDGTAGDIDIDVRNTGGPTGDFSEVGPASADTWFNVWLVLDHDAQTTDAYFNTGLDDATALGTSSFSGAAFRRGDGNDLVSFFVRNNESGTTGYIDDIYIDTTGENLVNPIPEPAPVLLGLIGVAGFLRRRR